MKLSVVIPVFNAEDFIMKSYNSIREQEIVDFEIIYVNNNSQDRSEEKIKELLNQDDRVKLMHQPKQGAAPARNMGIKAAKGEYIYVFDVDDEIYPKAINNMIDVLDNHPECDAVVGKMVKSDKGIADTTKPKDETGEVIFKKKPYWGLLWFRDLSSVVGPPAFLYRSTVFKTIGHYNENLKNNEDTALDIKLGMLCNIAFLDKYVYLYFKHGESTIELSKKKISRARMMWPRLIKEHLPFFLNTQTPKDFKGILCAQIFQSMGKQIVEAGPYSSRRNLKMKLLEDTRPLKIPWLIRFFLDLLVILPYTLVSKFYGYFVVPFVLQKIKKDS